MTHVEVGKTKGREQKNGLYKCWDEEIRKVPKLR